MPAIKDWKTETDDREKYGLYLASREWGVLKEAVHKRADGTCERCRKNPIGAVHHQTYVRKYQEKLDDLVGLCKDCHAFTHGKSDKDPAAKRALTLDLLCLGYRYEGSTQIEIPTWLNLLSSNVLDMFHQEVGQETVVFCFGRPPWRELVLESETDVLTVKIATFAFKPDAYRSSYVFSEFSRLTANLCEMTPLITIDMWNYMDIEDSVTAFASMIYMLSSLPRVGLAIDAPMGLKHELHLVNAVARDRFVGMAPACTPKEMLWRMAQEESPRVIGDLRTHPRRAF